MQTVDAPSTSETLGNADQTTELMPLVGEDIQIVLPLIGGQREE